MADPGETWFDRPAPDPAAACTLVCFPHAGGSATFFRDWATRLPGAEVLAVRYPGRAQRVDEPPPTDVRRLGRRIAEALPPLEGRGLVLFGHSMGAVVALETARALRSNGVPVDHLVASGSRDAPCPPPAPAEPEDDETLVAGLANLGGTAGEMLADPVFRELVLPYVRADSRMFHAYRHQPTPLLDCPVTTIAGDRDDDADLRPWSELTTAGCREVVRPGKHFYLIEDPPFAQLHGLVSTATGSSRRQPHGN